MAGLHLRSFTDTVMFRWTKKGRYELCERPWFSKPRCLFCAFGLAAGIGNGLASAVGASEGHGALLEGRKAEAPD